MNNRVSAGGTTVENDPKSATLHRTLPLPDRLVSVLKAVKRRQAAERLAFGAAYRSGSYVVSNEVGDPYSPAVLSRYWREAVEAAGLRHIKLHEAQHACATLDRAQGRQPHDETHAHSPLAALQAAVASLDRVVSSVSLSPVFEHGGTHRSRSEWSR